MIAAYLVMRVAILLFAPIGFKEFADRCRNTEKTDRDEEYDE